MYMYLPPPPSSLPPPPPSPPPPPHPSDLLTRRNLSNHVDHLVHDAVFPLAMAEVLQ